VFHEVWSQDLKIKANGARLTALLEKLQKESSPDERRKILSEVMCPQSRARTAHHNLRQTVRSSPSGFRFVVT
jgi:hypothetical protein